MAVTQAQRKNGTTSIMLSISFSGGKNVKATSLLNESQAAKVLGVSVRTIQGWRVKGGGPVFLKLGNGRGSVRYRLEDIEAYLADRTRRSTSDQGREAAG